jgi:hypothetical protein
MLPTTFWSSIFLKYAGMTTYAWNGPFPRRQFWGSHIATGPQYMSWGRQGDINVWDPEYLTQPLTTYTLPGVLMRKKDCESGGSLLFVVISFSYLY